MSAFMIIIIIIIIIIIAALNIIGWWAGFLAELPRPSVKKDSNWECRKVWCG